MDILSTFCGDLMVCAGEVEENHRQIRMIDRKIRNMLPCIRQSQHTIYCAMGPKSFSAVIARKTTAQSERHTKSNASVVLQEGFFQVVDW